MNPWAAVVTAVLGLWLWAAPKERAAMPLLLAAVLTTSAPVVDLGGAHFTVLRLLIAVGLLRVLSRGEGLAGGINGVDRLLVAWAAWLVASAGFHEDGTVMFRAGIAWNDLGAYLLLRVFVTDAEAVRRVFGMAILALVPVALLMGVEVATGANPFAVLGGVNAVAAVRDGHVRASGPFVHAILAGSVGASCAVMALALWQTRRGLAWAGLATAGAMLYAARSSGPILMLLSSLLGLGAWRLRARMASVRAALVAGCVLLAAVMNDPFYFILARVDITGGSRGWHRAQLIRSASEHLDEWWFAGTDFTRHWMASGIYANSRHTDITNHFLAQGVMGGLGLLALYGAALAAAFGGVGRVVAQADGRDAPEARLAWLLGAALFGWVMNFLSVSVYDQSSFFVFVVLASTGAVAVAAPATAAPDGWPADAKGAAC